MSASQRLYIVVSGAIFFMVALFHLFRLVYQWPIVVGPRTIPFVLSYVGLPASTAYFVWACTLLWRRAKRRSEPAAEPQSVRRLDR